MQANSGYKATLIASLINFLLTLFIVNTIGALVSGIYLGLAKDKGPKTYILFYFLSLIIYSATSMMKNWSTYSDPFKTVFVNLFSYLLLAFFPVLVAFVIAKVSRR